jgi:hypothetical protein
MLLGMAFVVFVAALCAVLHRLKHDIIVVERRLVETQAALREARNEFRVESRQCVRDVESLL